MQGIRENFTIYHPAVNFIYFVVVIMFTVIIMNPLFLLISLVCAVIYAVYLKGGHALKFAVGMVLPLLVLSVIINPLVNHRGSTILFELPWNLGPVTMESIIYGFSTGLMIGAVIMWFVSFNVIITSDKIIYLFGKILPGTSLVFVMILRFIPRYREQIKKISEAQQSVGMGMKRGTLRTKIKNGSRILSIMFTWALENAIQTADSMKSRGYGSKSRTSFMLYKINFMDTAILITMAVLVIGIVCAFVSGDMDVSYFPYLDFGFHQDHAAMIIAMGGCLCFAVLALIPVWLGVRESMYWQRMEAVEIKNE